MNTTSDPLFEEQERQALAAAHVGAYIAVPLVKEGVWVGVLSVLNIQPRDWVPTEIEAVQEVAERTWAAVERTRAERALRRSEEKYRSLFESRTELLRRLAEVEEDERRAIHRELHDRIGQDLASAKLNIDLARSAAGTEAATEERLEAARDLVQNAIDSSRNIMAELRPPGLDDHGLAVALELYAETLGKRHSIFVTVLGIELKKRLPSLAETSFFRIAQQAINNVAKHAKARKVDVSLCEKDQEVRLTISDDGSGFDVARLPQAGRYGFQIMRERAEAVDARLEVESAPGRGTRIIVILGRTA